MCRQALPSQKDLGRSTTARLNPCLHAQRSFAGFLPRRRVPVCKPRLNGSHQQWGRMQIHANTAGFLAPRRACVRMPWFRRESTGAGISCESMPVSSCSESVRRLPVSDKLHPFEQTFSALSTKPKRASRDSASTA